MPERQKYAKIKLNKFVHPVHKACEQGEKYEGFTVEYRSVHRRASEKLFTAVVAAVVCLVVIKILLKLVDRTLRRIHLDGTLKKLIRGGLKGLLLFLGVIVVLGCLDIPVTSLVAVLSVAGLALSLAVQNFLSNVAGGLQLLVSQPFKVGDYVEAGGCSGTVAEIGMFYTKLNSVDNKLVQLPNSTIVSQNILNYSSEESRYGTSKSGAGQVGRGTSSDFVRAGAVDSCQPLWRQRHRVCRAGLV